MKVLRIALSTLIIFILSLVFSSTSFARHGQVLGVSAQEQTSALPINQGPGLLLPDSPFYFIDLWRDNLNLLLASFDPEAKAKLHMKIAAERIVEVKLMLEAKNVKAAGLDTALNNLTQNVEGAKVVIKEQKNKGRSVEKLAMELNGTLDQQQQALQIVEKIGDNSIKLKIRAVRNRLDEDEVEIEDELPEDELDREIERELEDEVGEEVGEASGSAARIERLAERLAEEASKSAQKSLLRREEALKRVLEEQNKERERIAKDLQKSEEEKQKALQRVQQKVLEQARTAAKEVRQVSEDLREAQKKAEEIRSNSGSSGSSDSSSSGSSNSGKSEKND